MQVIHEILGWPSDELDWLETCFAPLKFSPGAPRNKSLVVSDMAPETFRILESPDLIQNPQNLQYPEDGIYTYARCHLQSWSTEGLSTQTLSDRLPP